MSLTSIAHDVNVQVRIEHVSIRISVLTLSRPHLIRHSAIHLNLLRTFARRRVHGHHFDSEQESSQFIRYKDAELSTIPKYVRLIVHDFASKLDGETDSVNDCETAGSGD